MSTEDPDAFTRHTHNGKDYYFCSEHCLNKFRSNPAAFLTRGAGDATKDKLQKPVAGGKYTCPMHPEIVQDTFGSCPKCGMALEPMTPTAGASRTEYTCPMHPEVVQDGPGACPKCGMALEPRTIRLEEEEKNPEYDYMRNRFLFGVILTVPLMIIAMRSYNFV